MFLYPTTTMSPRICFSCGLCLIIARLLAVADATICPPTTIYAKKYHAGYFKSPGYPLGYPNGLDCEWILNAPPGLQVEIYFNEVLTESCCDIIELRDGNSSSAGLLATYRGNTTESVYVSSFGSLHIRFRTDESYVASGFLAEYRIATTKSENCTRTLIATPNDTFLQSPGWPLEKYTNNLQCTWKIKAPEGKSVSVTFLEMDTEPCCDYILIRYGATMDSKTHELAGQIGESNQPEYISPDRTLQVIFRSDATIQRKGFSAVFKSVDREETTAHKNKGETEKCGGKIEVPIHGHSTLATPGYPRQHPNNIKCVWVLVAPPSHRVMLWFTSVRTEACCDFVKIRDGETPTSRKLGVLSGKGIPFASYVSTFNKLRVDFESDMTTASRGFRAVFEVLKDSTLETCGGVKRALLTKRRYLSSPNWPNSPSSPRCEWKIVARRGYAVVFQVIGFRTKSNRDELEFYDGNEALTPFAIMNGNSPPVHSRFYSSQNTMVVVFKPDTISTEGGFRAYYKAILKRDIPTRATVRNETD